MNFIICLPLCSQMALGRYVLAARHSSAAGLQLLQPLVFGIRQMQEAGSC